jgi:hypothetical protein
MWFPSMKVDYSYSIYHNILHIFNINLHICTSEMDGDQSVEFVYIDPTWSAERIAGKRKYAGHMYYQYEPEESWTRPGVRAFGRVNGGAIFEACYLIDKGCVPLLSVFYSDKAHSKGWSHHPIYRELYYNAYFVYSAYAAYLYIVLLTLTYFVFIRMFAQHT